MDWFTQFTGDHLRRCPHSEWPKAPEAVRTFFAVWKDDFRSAGVTLAEATAASMEMAKEDSRFPNRHLPTLMAKIRDARRSAVPEGDFASIAAAKEACRNCPWGCGGEGVVSIPHATRGTVAAHCRCGAGRLVRSKLAEKDPALVNRFPLVQPGPHIQPTDAQIEAAWDGLDDRQKAMWLEAAAEARTALRPGRSVSMPLHNGFRAKLLEATAKAAAYKAEILGVDPFPEFEPAGA